MRRMRRSRRSRGRVSGAAAVARFIAPHDGRDRRGVGGRRAAAQPAVPAGAALGRACRPPRCACISAPGRCSRSLSTGAGSAAEFLVVAMVVWFANGPDARGALWSLLTGFGPGDRWHSLPIRG